jgi:hypothetical protein
MSNRIDKVIKKYGKRYTYLIRDASAWLKEKEFECSMKLNYKKFISGLMKRVVK